MQETFLMIKPDGIKHKDAIFARLEQAGLKIQSSQQIKTDMHIMKILLEIFTTKV